jgi:hypothetical protein
MLAALSSYVCNNLKFSELGTLSPILPFLNDGRTLVGLVVLFVFCFAQCWGLNSEPQACWATAESWFLSWVGDLQRWRLPPQSPLLCREVSCGSFMEPSTFISSFFFIIYLSLLLLLCWVRVHWSIYKGSYNVSDISYLNSPPALLWSCCLLCGSNDRCADGWCLLTRVRLVSFIFCCYIHIYLFVTTSFQNRVIW